MDRELGPLAGLEGAWEGDTGVDVAPDDDRAGKEIDEYRERMTFVATGLVENHEQKLFGLRYTTTAWRLGEDDPFHEEVGYWMWDASAGQVIRCFMVPRGVTVIAGGTSAADASAFELACETYGICSSLFLDREFKTVRYALRFEKRDENTLTRVD